MSLASRQLGLVRGRELELVPSGHELLGGAHELELRVGSLETLLQRGGACVAPSKLGLHLRELLLCVLRGDLGPPGAQVGSLRHLALGDALSLDGLQPLREQARARVLRVRVDERLLAAPQRVLQRQDAARLGAAHEALLVRLVAHAPRRLLVRRRVGLRELVLVAHQRELLLAQPDLLARRVELQPQPPRRPGLLLRLGARRRDRLLRAVEPLLLGTQRRLRRGELRRLGRRRLCRWRGNGARGEGWGEVGARRKVSRAGRARWVETGGGCGAAAGQAAWRTGAHRRSACWPAARWRAGWRR